MKIQSLAVVFAIIILPIVIILSYYIHAEVDTIAIQTSYDTKLIDSTHDAMVAFEINTANEDLSTVADSLRSIIEASTNVFFNTLATNLGISNAGNSAVDSYVPALLYTLYSTTSGVSTTAVSSPVRSLSVAESFLSTFTDASIASICCSANSSCANCSES